MKRILTVTAALGLVAGSALANEIKIDFETAPGALVEIVTFSSTAADPTPGVQTVNLDFDYIAAGLPLAPNSNPGDTKGFYVRSNEGPTASQMIANLFINVPTALENVSAYSLQFDVYFANAGTTTTSSTTEFGYYGVSATPGVAAWSRSQTLGAGAVQSGAIEGIIFGTTGDGGSASDLVYYEGNGTDVGYYPGLPAWWNSSPTSPTDGAGALMNYRTTVVTPNPWATFFDPAVTGSTKDNSPENIWLTIELQVIDGEISVFYTPPGRSRTQVSSTFFAGTGLASASQPSAIELTLGDARPFIGYGEIFTSIADAAVFAVFDNIIVREYEVPEVPTSAGVWEMYQ